MYYLRYNGLFSTAERLQVLCPSPDAAQGDFLPGVLCDRYDNVQLDLVGFQMVVV